MAMKPFIRRAVVGLTLLGAGLVLSVGCTHDNSTIFVFDVLAPQLVSNGGPCMFTSETTQAFISSGFLDVALRDNYTPTFLVGNQMVPEVNSQQLMTETSTVQIQGAIVRITDSAGTQLANFTRLTSATIFPSTGGVPSFAPVTVLVLDSNTIASQNVALGATSRLVTFTKFFGQTLGGRNVETGEFEFPVDICSGCLISFSAANNSPACPQPNCVKALTGTMMMQQSVSCTPGQDSAIDCSVCVGSVAACSGANTTPTALCP
jgi:hypothetical protein